MKITPSFLLATAAIVLAASGAGYAGTMIGSDQIKDNSVASVDIKNHTILSEDIASKTITSSNIKNDLSGAVLRSASVPGRALKRDCATTSIKLAGVCMTKAAQAPVALQSAIDFCDKSGGRLPTYAEIKELVTHNAVTHGFTWSTDGMLNQYEWTSTYVLDTTFNAVTSDYSGNVLTNDAAPTRGFHCVTYP